MKGFEILVDAMLYAVIFGAISAGLAYVANNGMDMGSTVTGLAVAARNLAVDAVNGNLVAAAILGSFAGITYYAVRQTYKIIVFLGILGGILLISAFL